MTGEGAALGPAGGSNLPVRAALLAGLGCVGVVLGAVVAELALREVYLLAIAAAVVLPIAVSLYHRPFAVVALWLLVAPLVMLVDGSAPRRVFWLVHRLLPLAALGATLAAPALGTAVRRLPRPGAPELLMSGYLVASLVSIYATSPNRFADTFLLYDRVAVPMVLFLVVRLNVPDERTLDRWFPVLATLVLSQAAFGVLSWVAPGLLPDPWLNRAGSRTTGSLQHPNVYGISLLFAAVLSFHLGRHAPPRTLRRFTSVPLLVIGTTMAILTLSRATWLAAIVVLVGVACTYPRPVLKMAALLLPAILLVVSSGALGITSQGISDRLYSSTSEESALSRLPVVVASVRMFEARPVTGWGYGRFDDYDQQFQEGITGLFVPTKDHASHNLYLTIAAEQGIVGLVLYAGPAAAIAVRTARVRRALRTRPRLRQQVVVLWLVLGGHVVVTMFSNMRVSFGLGVWWLCLALVAVATDRVRPLDQARRRRRLLHPPGPDGPLPVTGRRSDLG